VPRNDSTTSLDGWFGITRIHRLATRFFAGVGLPIDAIWQASDMFPAERKYPHAFCIGIDNPSDVRVLCNLDSTRRWMETTLHEFGHAVYNKGIDEQLPFLLRNPAHTFITEAVAMFFGRQSRDATWLESLAGVPQDRAVAADSEQREAQLVFIRWALLVTRFERALYRDPDADLNTLWWELSEQLQGLRRPEGWDAPDWAAKIHLACFPVYYQNYILGELLASQFQVALQDELGTDERGHGVVVQNRAVGTFFGGLFELGQSLPWQQTVRRITGQQLQAECWVGQFVAD
jgi:peptidyl-dipeptidase A